MSPRTSARLLVAVLALAVAGSLSGCGVFSQDETKKLTASFKRTVGLYVNSDVRVLGVKIGRVTSITPQGEIVRVTMEYDAKYKLPADAKAVVVSPSIVSDRYVQITPVWRSGEALPAEFELPMERTAVPVELDEIYSALDELNRALGPDGANKNGALGRLLDVGAQNLKGNGQLLNSTLADLSKAVETLATSREDLFGTVGNLQDFTTTIANSDQTVRQFNADLADVAAQLSGERDDLALAVKQLSLALGEVATFVRDNKGALTDNVRDLASITSTLVKQKRALEEFLDNSAVALTNLQLAYNPRSGTLDTRDNNGGQTEKSLVCGIFTAIGQPCPSMPGSAPAAPASASDSTLGGILEARR